jgi:HK97 family phage prohead protease
MREKTLVIKALGDEEAKGSFEGYLSTYGNADRDGDVILLGAFAEGVAKTPTVPLCFNHDRNNVIGRLDLSDDGKGLKVKGTLNLGDPLAANIGALIHMGALSKMSVGMLIEDYEPQDPKRPFGAWNIKKALAVEGSVVTVPANELAAIEQHKAIDEKERAELESLRAERRVEAVKRIIEEARSALGKEQK